MLQTLHVVIFAGTHTGPVQLACQCLIENFVDQRGFAAAGYAGDAGKGTQRNGHIHILQIVLLRAADFEGFAVTRPSAAGQGNFFVTGQILSRDAPGLGDNILQ